MFFVWTFRNSKDNNANELNEYNSAIRWCWLSRQCNFLYCVYLDFWRFNGYRRNHPRLRIQELIVSNPLIQIDDEVREMTDEEYAQYEASIADAQPVISAE
jgi:hypothetical protein